MRRHLVLHGAIEQAPTTVGRTLDEPEIVGRESDHRDPAEQLVGVAHRLAVEARRPAAVADRHLDLALAGIDRQCASNARLLRVDADELGELLGPERAERADQVTRLEKVRLALPVRSEEHRGERAERDALGREVPEVVHLDFAQDQRPTPSSRDRSGRPRPCSCTGSPAGNARPASSSPPPGSRRDSQDGIAGSRRPRPHLRAPRGKKCPHPARQGRVRHARERSSPQAALSPESCRGASKEERRTRWAAPCPARRPA